MSNAYFLIPGGLLPPKAASEALDAEARQSLEELLGDCRASAPQQLAQGLLLPFARCTHHLWFWAAVTRARTTPAHAGYEWLAENGPALAGEVWSVTPCRLRDGRTAGLGGSPLTPQEVEQCSPALRAVLEKSGFVLQLWDAEWYATRKQDWEVVARPWRCQEGFAADDEEALAGDRGAALALMKACGEALAGTQVSQRRREAGLPAPDFAWISGGGRAVRFYPPTKVRAVLSDEPVLLSWAREAGILKEYTASASALAWPADAPPGDVIAVVSDLWEPWLQSDWQAWRRALPKTLDKVRTLRSLARLRGSETAAFVACGRGCAVTLAPERKTLHSRLLGRFSTRRGPGLAWIADPGLSPDGAAP